MQIRINHVIVMTSVTQRCAMLGDWRAESHSLWQRRKAETHFLWRTCSLKINLQASREWW